MIKGTVLNLKRLEIHDGEGLRTTLFLKGCPLRCLWCHNPETLDRKPMLGYYSHKCIACGACVEACIQNAHTVEDGVHRFNREACIACGNCADACLGDALVLYGKSVTPEEILPSLLEDRAFYEASGGGVTISGGEPLFQAEFTAALLRCLKDEGIHTALDTCLYTSRAVLEQVLPYTDMFLVDVKAIDPRLHRRLTGQDNRIILENLHYLSERKAQIEIRIPFIPTLNDSEIPSIASYLSSLPFPPVGVRVLPYHHLSDSKYASLGMTYPIPQVPLPTAEACEKAKEVLRGCGMKVCGE